MNRINIKMNAFDIYWNSLSPKRGSSESLNWWVSKIGYTEIHLYKLLALHKKKQFYKVQSAKDLNLN